ncbi:polygalacturonase-like [Populus nigra]|uniref:polygalacturonase-like n=1 Tax=Populus nigra TaxID=3691 RepID=UPI002B2696E3|nr:polygalacturonase-like [Populus nigra]
MGFTRILFLTLLFVWAADVQCQNVRIFNVKKYGAIPDSKTENSKAFLEAWKNACKWNGKAVVLVPAGTYLLDSVKFEGECKGYMIFKLKGNVMAASKLKDINQWITFKYVNGLTVAGSGTFDGQGYKSLRLEFIRNGKLQNIRSINSQNAHVSIFASSNLNITNVKLSAPQDSPNTDGIKISSSEEIRITRTSISTGDDCVAILNGSKNTHISQVFCGPGHGISVGSMGGNTLIDNKDIVVGLAVTNSTFTNTSNGLRIKTWASRYEGLASGFTYEDIIMNDVEHPIIIDQQYCPSSSCDSKTASRIQIRDITYSNIRGTSKSKAAVTLNCSSIVPCKNIVLKDIRLVYTGNEGPASSICSNVHGYSYGLQNPPPCFRSA